MVGATLTIWSPGYRGCFLVEPGSVGSAIFLVLLGPGRHGFPGRTFLRSWPTAATVGSTILAG